MSAGINVPRASFLRVARHGDANSTHESSLPTHYTVVPTRDKLAAFQTGFDSCVSSFNPEPAATVQRAAEPAATVHRAAEPAATVHRAARRRRWLRAKQVVILSPVKSNLTDDEPGGKPHDCYHPHIPPITCRLVDRKIGLQAA
jgi:hypothetical protein